MHNGADSQRGRHTAAESRRGAVWWQTIRGLSCSIVKAVVVGIWAFLMGPFDYYHISNPWYGISINQLFPWESHSERKIIVSFPVRQTQWPWVNSCLLTLRTGEQQALLNRVQRRSDTAPLCYASAQRWLLQQSCSTTALLQSSSSINSQFLAVATICNIRLKPWKNHF